MPKAATPGNRAGRKNPWGPRDSGVPRDFSLEVLLQRSLGRVRHLRPAGAVDGRHGCRLPHAALARTAFLGMPPLPAPIRPGAWSARIHGGGRSCSPRHIGCFHCLRQMRRDLRRQFLSSDFVSHFVLPFHDETKCYQRKARRGLFATVGVAGCSLAAGVRLPENECSHGTTIGKQRAPVNPRKPRPKETANAKNDRGPVRPGGTLSEDRPKAVGGVTICGCERGERDWRGHIREKIR
jgi:hypothetical protein